MVRHTVLRRDYLDALNRHRNRTDIVKVITGIRRSGKSTLMQQYATMLREDGVKEEQITYLNLDSKTNKGLLDEDALYRFLISKRTEGRSYFLLDEIQNVPGWERAIDSLMIDMDADIYVTGSNAYFLSTELSTYLTGRSISLHMLPLSFKEFMELNELDDSQEAFGLYLSVGSMPIVRKDMSKDDALGIVGAIRSDIMVKDIAFRKRLTDVSMLERMSDYLFSEIGNPISGNSISKQLRIDNKTAESYLQMIRESLMFYQARRYDLRGRVILTTPSKYYCTDLGMRNSAIGEYSRDIGRSIENIVYLELMRRGYSIHVGKLGNLEIDFVADKGGRREYYQVSMTLLDDDTYGREVHPLTNLNEEGRKIVLTMDRIGMGLRDGIEVLNIIDWLLEPIDGGH